METNSYSALLRFLEEQKAIALLTRVEECTRDPISFLRSNYPAAHLGISAKPNFINPIQQWYAGLPDSQKSRYPEINKALQNLLTALVDILQQGVVRNASEARDLLRRCEAILSQGIAGFPEDPMRVRAAQMISLIVRAEPTLQFLGRPGQSYQETPDELIAWVLGVSAEDLACFERALPEVERGLWLMSLHYLMDDLIQWPNWPGGMADPRYRGRGGSQQAHEWLRE